MAFENLYVWQRAARLSADLYKSLSECRDRGFKDQITRSSLSVPSNIAEGMERESDKEKVRFLDIAKGSAAELRTQIHIGMEIGYIPKDMGSRWIAETKEISAMIVGLMQSLKSAN
ncbi:four helix bundle protein [Sulfuritortus calidifontis]|uniref:Four helix bundle protein n=1 Tax=Sulfuritortus calidifontis TaxID=1914471 RepID=A0A4R3JW76_9PROT|nr:four helix bundle protein [Sulfuritortus calidifontis]TCS72466.1 four helix bundle protein [Sulfuritortus calidifontis]